MVVGARVPPDGIVKGNDVIAWVELRIDGRHSWRELPRASYMSFRAPQEDDPPNEPVVVPPEPEPTPEPQPSPQPTQQPDPQDDPDDEQEQVAASRSWQWLLWLLVPAAVGALPAYKLVRRAAPPPRRPRLAEVRRRVAGARRHRPRPRARRPDAAQPPRPGGRAGGGFARPRPHRRRRRLRPRRPLPDSADSYWRAVLESRTHLGAGLPWWRRWLAPFSPASLRRS